MSLDLPSMCVGALVALVFAFGLSWVARHPARPHPLTRARSGWHSLTRTPRRNPTTPTVFPTILDERRYVVPPRPRYPDPGLPDHRPRLTPPPSRVARLDQLFKEYGESSQAMRDGLEDLARIVREQHGYVNDKKQWVPGSLHSDPEPPPDPSRESPA